MQAATSQQYLSAKFPRKPKGYTMQYHTYIYIYSGENLMLFSLLYMLDTASKQLKTS